MQYLTKLKTTINDALYEVTSRTVTENEQEQEAMG